jgi:hypothetical protein
VARPLQGATAAAPALSSRREPHRRLPREPCELPAARLGDDAAGRSRRRWRCVDSEFPST